MGSVRSLILSLPVPLPLAHAHMLCLSLCLINKYNLKKKKRHLLEYQLHLIPCFANLLMVVQRNNRTKENMCKTDESSQGIALTYDPTTALQDGFYPALYNIIPNRKLAQSAQSPYLPSSVCSYQKVTQTSPLQVLSPSWMHH